MIETETVDSLPTLRGKVKVPFAVRLGRTEHSDAILGTICHGHVWNRSIVWVKDDTLDALGKLGLFNDYKFSNCLCRCDKKRA